MRRMDDGTYALIRRAIHERRQVLARFDGRPRGFCPHAIGTRDGRPCALVFQFEGYSSRGLPPGGDWRCLDLDRLSEASLHDGPWHTKEHSQRQHCVDEVDLSIVA
jgi:hypothetical protein